MAKIKKEEYPIKNNGFEYMGNHYDCHYAIERDMKMIIQEAETSHKDNFDEFYDRNTLRPRTMRLYVDENNIPIYGMIIYVIDYKNKGSYFQIIYTNDRFGKNYKKLNYVILQGTKIKLENIKNLNTCKQIRFIPKNNYIMMYVIYEKSEVKLKENNNRYLSIDLGINNLCSCVTNCKLNSFIIDGKKLNI